MAEAAAEPVETNGTEAAPRARGGRPKGSKNATAAPRKRGETAAHVADLEMRVKWATKLIGEWVAGEESEGPATHAVPSEISTALSILQGE